ncbi:flippase [Ruminococcus sp.]|uniref:flippase n=1 Tax=Ruminococcus sp. TaxID=41978 RepID=UPI0025F13257|nr:flippase [Ruminococcus sp.]
MISSIVNKAKTSRVFKNISWLVGGKIVQMIIAFVVNILTARYLGSSDFGLINYASVYTGFFSSLCSLGLNSVIVKEMIDHKDKQGELLGTSIVLRLIASALSWVSIICLSCLIDKGEPLTTKIVGLCCIGMLFQAFTILEYWFQARLESKVCAIATIIAYLIMSAYKVVLLILGKSVEWFAVATSIDYIVIVAFVYMFYKKKGGPQFSFSWSTGKNLLSQSYHFIISTLMVSIYGNTDKFMLKHMLHNTSSVGNYGVAVQLCMAWVFVLQAIIDSFYPSIMELHKQDYEKYKKRNIQLYGIIFYVSLIASVGITFIAKPAVLFLYDDDYIGAVEPLKVITWYTAFSYLGVARNAWLVCEGKQKYLKYLYGSAVVLNILINWILIPKFGVTGAAVASLITQIGTSIVLPLFIKPIRENSILMLKGITFRR